MKKGAKITSLVINALIFLSILGGTLYVLFIQNRTSPINARQLAQIQTAWPLGIAGLVMAVTDMFALMKKKHKLAGFPIWIKFITTSAITFLVIYLVVMATLINSEASSGYPSLMSLVTTPYGLSVIVIPFLLSIVSFLFIEKGRAISYKWFWTACLVPVIYGALILTLNSLGMLETPVFFLQKETWKGVGPILNNLLYIGTILVVLMVIGLLMLLFHNAGIKGRFAALDEDIDETPVDAKNTETAIIEEAVDEKKIIHINQVGSSYQLVVSDTGTIEMYSSQAEAIKAACKKADKVPYSIRVHVSK